MPVERASVFESMQFGVEITPGTAVAANKRLLSVGLDVDPNIPTEIIRPTGQKFATELIPGKEQSDSSLQGAVGYNCLTYLLAALMKTPAITTPTNNDVWTLDTTGATTGTFKLTYNAIQTPAITFSVTQTTLITNVQVALDALSSVGPGNFFVQSAGANMLSITAVPGFARGLALTADFGSLTGGTPALNSTGATLTRQSLITMNQFGPDIITTYSIQKGSSAGASKFAYGFVDQMDISISRQTVGLSGKMVGQQLTDGITMTASPTDILLKTVAPKHCSIFISADDLTYTRLVRCLDVKWSLSGRFSPFYTVDDSQQSFVTHVEAAPDCMINITVEQDSTANGYMTDLRNRTKKYVIIRAVGDTIETGFPYLIEIKMPFKFREPKRGDKDSVYTGSYDLYSCYDSTLGYPLQVRMQNIISAL